MATDDKAIRIPIWLAALLMSAILAIAADTWRSVQAVKTDLQCLKTVLASKGLIDPSICLESSRIDQEQPGSASFDQDRPALQPDPVCCWVIYGAFTVNPAEITLPEYAKYYDFAWMELPP